MIQILKYTSTLLFAFALLGCDLESLDSRISDAPPLNDESSSSLAVTIEWQIPELRENGDTLMLSEIGGYQIAYRKDEETEYRTILITDHTQSQIVVDNLSTGRYEFKVSSFDSGGIYGQYSPSIFAIIDGA